MGQPARKIFKPASVIVTLKGKCRALKNARVVGPVTVKKLESVKGRHMQVEITGIEIEGFGHSEIVDNTPIV
jgi:hypothetical protein